MVKDYNVDRRIEIVRHLKKIILSGVWNSGAFKPWVVAVFTFTFGCVKMVLRDDSPCVKKRQSMCVWNLVLSQSFRKPKGFKRGQVSSKDGFCQNKNTVGLRTGFYHFSHSILCPVGVRDRFYMHIQVYGLSPLGCNRGSWLVGLT